MARQDGPVPLEQVFVLPVLDQLLIYAPLQDFAALVDHRAVERLPALFKSSSTTTAGSLAGIVSALRSQPESVPGPRTGRFSPRFLGLIPTRACNLACEYCGFLGGDGGEQEMDLPLLRHTLDWYLGLVQEKGSGTAAVHYFGGEPFCAERVVDFAHDYARLRAGEMGLAVRFEVSTNGTMSEERCRWVAGSLDSVILSLDGPEDVQNRQRPAKGGGGSYASVARNAKILSEGAAQLSFRACVTDETVGRMPEIAAWLCADFRPVAVCFEPVQPTPHSERAGLRPPDPWSFAEGMIRSAGVLESHGVEPVYTAADIRTRRVTFCPVGRDVPIVSPGGSVSACYLLPQEWEAKGLDLGLGRITGGHVTIEPEGVVRARALNVQNKPACTSCFCRWHCAGGCHVNHILPETPGAYDAVCLQTRIIALRNILHAMGRDEMVARLLESPRALEVAALQASDLILDGGGQG